MSLKKIQVLFHALQTDQFWKYLVSSGFYQSAITCSKLTIETLEQGVKYV